MLNPLADSIRPSTLEDVVGQEHILGKGEILYNIIQSGHIPNMIFYGPSGTGKTTISNIIASQTGRTLYKLNATTASVSDIRDIISRLDGFEGINGVILYLDEIQNFNKKQQQSLLEFIENGKITLIASTTENPYFYIYNAILSRCNIFEFRPVSAENIEKAVVRAVETLKATLNNDKIIFTDEAITHIANMAAGDVRKSLNACELCVYSTMVNENGEIIVDLESAVAATQKKAIKYDRDGDSHYDILSAFQKSIRGSDPDAAIHYLARLISAGDMASINRRLLVIAAEDIGLAYPQAIVTVKACVDSANQLGFPEAAIPLSEAVLLLATAPKSNSAAEAISAAMADIENNDVGDVPLHLKDGHYSGAKKMGRSIEYLYPHAYPNSYIAQQYLPDNIAQNRYYKYGSNKTEQAAKEYWKRIKGEEK